MEDCGNIGAELLHVASRTVIPIEPDRIRFLWVTLFPGRRRYYVSHHPPGSLVQCPVCAAIL